MCHPGSQAADSVLSLTACKLRLCCAVCAVLQVEHGITEMVNGHVDIVEWMLRLQLGQFMQPLDFSVLEKEIKRSGWSIEVREGVGGGLMLTCQW